MKKYMKKLWMPMIAVLFLTASASQAVDLAKYARPWLKLTADTNSMAVVAAQLAELKAAQAALPAGAGEDVKDQYKMAITPHEGVLDAQAPIELCATIVASVHKAEALSIATSWALFFKGDAYVDAWIVLNAGKGNTIYPVKTCGLVVVTDAASAKRKLLHDLALSIGSHRIPLTRVIESFKRVEIIERRAAGLSVVGGDSLPKTKAVTDAINSGKNLVPAISAFVGTSLPHINDAIAAKIAGVTALKNSVNSGVTDPSPAVVEVIGSWLGVEPTAAWTRAYNGQ
jgi:hypothetical protein